MSDLKSSNVYIIKTTTVFDIKNDNLREQNTNPGFSYEISQECWLFHYNYLSLIKN